MKKKIVFVSTHPIQYQTPIFKKLYKLNKSFIVFFNNKIKKHTEIKDYEFKKNIKWGNNLVKDYKYEIFRKKNYFILNLYNAYKFLKLQKIEYLILSGWNNLFYQSIFVIAKILNIKIILRCENNLYETNYIKKRIKVFFLSKIFKFFYKFIAIGKKNDEMYRECGISKDKIVKSNYSIDNDFFSKKKILKKKELYLKNKYKTHNKKVFLFVGKFINRKGINVLLDAITHLNNFPTIARKSLFLLVGQGPELTKTREFIKSKKISIVNLINFKTQNDLRYYYKISNFLVLPSFYETWGLVVNEAMAMEKPAITSNSCGCANDLVLNDKNGYIFRKGNSKELSKLIIKILQNKKIESRLKKEVKKKLKFYTIDKNVKDILNIT
jgi:glycosyltransferase involved in cell wall biosynthesis